MVRPGTAWAMDKGRARRKHEQQEQQKGEQQASGPHTTPAGEYAIPTDRVDAELQDFPPGTAPIHAGGVMTVGPG